MILLGAAAARKCQTNGPPHHQADINSALQTLRWREFQAGRYNPEMRFLDFPVDAGTPGPGAEHASIEEAIQDADADGTRSILDMERISDEPDYGVVTALSDDDLIDVSQGWRFREYSPTAAWPTNVPSQSPCDASLVLLFSNVAS